MVVASLRQNLTSEGANDRKQVGRGDTALLETTEVAYCIPTGVAVPLAGGGVQAHARFADALRAGPRTPQQTSGAGHASEGLSSPLLRTQSDDLSQGYSDVQRNTRSSPVQHVHTR